MSKFSTAGAGSWTSTSGHGVITTTWPGNTITHALPPIPSLPLPLETHKCGTTHQVSPQTYGQLVFNPPLTDNTITIRKVENGWILSKGNKEYVYAQAEHMIPMLKGEE